MGSEGIQESIVLAKELTSQNINRIYSSLLKRALSTSKIICERLGVKPIIVKELKERNAGTTGEMNRTDLSLQRQLFFGCSTKGQLNK